jgi:hypothetical protein
MAHWSSVAATVAFSLALTSLGLFVGPTASLRPDAQTVAVIFPPWWPPSAALAAAAQNGRIIGAGAAPGLLIVHADAPGLAIALRRAGALLIFNPLAAGGCGRDRSLSHG